MTILYRDFRFSSTGFIGFAYTSQTGDRQYVHGDRRGLHYLNPSYFMLSLCIQQCTFVPRAIPRSLRPWSVWAGDPVLSALWCFTGIPAGVLDYNALA